MKILKALFLLIPLAAGFVMMNSCHKEKFSTKGDLNFSTDTLTFDTVFTTLGSTTMYFTVRNTQSKSLNVSDIKLMQLQGTQFRINVDGVSGTEFKNVDIPAHDSIYVFVEVTVNPNTATNPFVIIDQIQFITNGNTQNVVLEAMGQNAYYHFSDSIVGNIIWPRDKPHIIVNKNGGLPVLEIKAGATLTIQPKTQIYMGPNAVITVDGNLIAHGGDWNDSIVFQYIRHDYANAPGQYLGITYGRNTTNTTSINMDHVVIDQSTFGVSDEYVLDVLASAQITTSLLTNYASVSNIPTVTLDKCIIRNCSSTAMTAIRTNLTMTNCLLYSSGDNMVALGMGGTYNITNCTWANLNTQYVNHQNPTFLVTDFINYLDGTKVGPYPTTVNINNTAIVGTQTNELGLPPIPSMVNITFQNCNLTTVVDSFHLIQPNDSGCIYNSNTNTLFEAYYNNNYTPDSTLSPLTDSGSIALQKPKDLFDFTRDNNHHHSVGAIEFHNP